MSWQGKYSLNSSEWNKIDQKILNKLLNVQELENGYFLIEFNDFCDLFDDIYLNYIGFDYIFGKNSNIWYRHFIYGEFLSNVNSGGKF
jgi:hypothetical protein